MSKEKRDSILDAYMTAHAELLEIHVKSLEENQIMRVSLQKEIDQQETLIKQQAKEMNRLQMILNKRPNTESSLELAVKALKLVRSKTVFETSEDSLAIWEIVNSALDQIKRTTP